MNEPKPVYCIKSRGGRIEKEGDFTDIVAWLKENRVTCDDDLRRLGYHILEKDELWGRVKDFPEFNQTERQGRRALHRARNIAYISVFGGFLIAALGVALISYNQVIPRYAESNKVDDARAEAAAARKLEEMAKINLKNLRSDTDATLRAQEQAMKKERDEFSRKVAELRNAYDKYLADNQKNLGDENAKLNSASLKAAAELKAANSRISALIARMEAERSDFESKLAASDARLAPLTAQIRQLKEQNQQYLDAYVSKDEELRSERAKSIVQKIFGGLAEPIEK